MTGRDTQPLGMLPAKTAAPSRPLRRRQSRPLAVLLAALTTAAATGCSHLRAVPQAPCGTAEHGVAGASELQRLAGADPGLVCLSHVWVDGFLEDYFRVFEHHEEPLEVSRWAWAARPGSGLVLDTLEPAGSDFFDALDREAAWEDRGSIDRPGIAVATTALRAMPTARPLMRPPGPPGRGFPFDLLQNSLVNANEPLWLSHRSSSGEWTFAFTSYASGWIESRDLAALSDEQVLALRRLTPLACVADGYTIHDREGRFLFSTRVGMVLPLFQRTESEFSILTAVPDASKGDAVLEVVSIPAEVAVTVPMAPTVGNFSLVAERLLGSPYGWGGLYRHRDCSATIRDLFMPFGLWLPRNSREQALTGEIIDLADLHPTEKQELIVERARPFATLLYKPGHILLFVGKRDGVPFVFHTVWALKTRAGSSPMVRRHIGRTIVSPLCSSGPAGSSLLEDLVSMRILDRCH